MNGVDAHTTVEPELRASRPATWIELGRVIGLALLAAALTALATRHGPGLTPDSVYYLSTGQNLAVHGELRQMIGTTLTVFPPALPVLVAGGVWLGLDAESAVRCVCVLSAGATVALSFSLLRLVVRSAVTLWTATALVALSPVILGVDRMAWTEPPFLAVTVAMLVVMAHLAIREVRPAPVIVLITLCWAAFLLRYAAVALIPLCAVAVGALSAGPLRRRIAAGTAVAVAAALVPVLWVRRNHRTDGTYMGLRSPSLEGVPDVLLRVPDVLSSWVAPLGPPWSRAPLLLALTSIVILSALSARRSGARQDTPLLRVGALLIGFVLVYVAYLVLAQLNSRLDPIDSRLLSPVYVPLLVLVTVAIETGIRSGRAWARPAAAAIAFAAMLVFAGASLDETMTAFNQGVGFNETNWRSSRVATALERQPSLTLAITNGEIAAYHVWSVARVDLVTWIGSPSELEAYATAVECAPGRSMLVWFGPHDPLLEAAAAGTVNLDLVSQHDDGSLYEISVDPAAPITC